MRDRVLGYRPTNYVVERPVCEFVNQPQIAGEKTAPISVSVQQLWHWAKSRKGDRDLMKVSRGKWSTISAVLLSLAALLFAAPASADQNDDVFVGELQRHGITFADRNAAIAAGHNMCAGLDKRQTPTSLVMNVVEATDLSAKDAGYLLGASVASYCPQHRGVVGN